MTDSPVVGLRGEGDARCEECELVAARMAYAAELGASEWEAFIHRVPVCEECVKVRVLLGGSRA